jgi:hypothetical protein
MAMIPMRICVVEISGRLGLRPNWVSSSCQLSPRGRCISGGSMPPGGVESKVRNGADLKNAPISKTFWCTYPNRQRSLARLGLRLPGGLNPGELRPISRPRDATPEQVRDMVASMWRF